MKTTVQILRWVGVLPAAIVAPFLACLLVNLFALIADFISGDFRMFYDSPVLFQIEHFPSALISYGLYGFLMIHVGCAVAPNFKKVVALALFALNAILFGILIVLCFIFLKFADCWVAIIGSIICIISAAIAAFSIVSNDDAL